MRGQCSGGCVWLGRAGSAKDSDPPRRSVVLPRREYARRGEEKLLAPLCPQRAPFRSECDPGCAGRPLDPHADGSRGAV